MTKPRVRPGREQNNIFLQGDPQHLYHVFTKQTGTSRTFNSMRDNSCFGEHENMTTKQCCGVDMTPAGSGTGINELQRLVEQVSIHTCFI